MTDDNAHVVPVYGRAHVFSEDCWCKPKWDDVCPDLLIHNREDECSPSAH